MKSWRVGELESWVSKTMNEFTNSPIPQLTNYLIDIPAPMINSVTRGEAGKMYANPGLIT
jgi:hypothetical protein